jgi:hypothetical protein
VIVVPEAEQHGDDDRECDQPDSVAPVDPHRQAADEHGVRGRHGENPERAKRSADCDRILRKDGEREQARDRCHQGAGLQSIAHLIEIGRIVRFAARAHVLELPPLTA